jgi:hypothetical protein
LIEEIYARADKWIGVIPDVIGLSGRLYPGGLKVKNINPNVAARNEINAVTYLKLEVDDVFLYNIRVVHDAVDADMLNRFKLMECIISCINF